MFYFDPSPDYQEIKKDEDRIMEGLVNWLVEYVSHKAFYDSMVNSPIKLNVSV